MAVVVKKGGSGAGQDKANRTFSGSRAATGNSRGFRLEKAFFRAAPEFEEAGTVRVDLIGPGKALLSVDSPLLAGEDPVIGAWLSFIEADLSANPQRLELVSEAELAGYERLVEGIRVADDEPIPDDVTF